MSDAYNSIHGDYQGKRMPLFLLALKTTILTMLTLGIYRFWAKTRIRKYIWSSISGNDDTFEYTGTGLEKFLGFLVAIVILAIYLGIVQMILFYFGMNIFREPANDAEMVAQIGAIYITVFAALPLMFFAQYRARRYKLARTRWRGIRFGAENAAWGYAFRVMGHGLLTIFTLGILLPRQTFKLEKYVTDRSWYGSAKFEQNGRWTALYPAMKHLFIAFGIFFVATVCMAFADINKSNFGIGLATIAMVIGYIWFWIGFVSYRVRSFEYLTDNKVLDGGVTFRATPKTGTIIKIVILGGLLIALIAAVLFAILAAILNATVLSAFQTAILTGSEADMGNMIAIYILLIVLYVLTLAVLSAMSLAWIMQPIIEHVVESLCIVNGEGLNAVRQRETDKGADAEGFADALDIGGAI